MTRNKMPERFAWRFMAGLTTILAMALSAAAQTVVVGTGDPDTDVKAVQGAVDQGGNVILKGHFSFNAPPTVPTATAFAGGLATVVVSKGVAITGTPDEDGEMASIDGGTTPFYVDATGARVLIRGLRFIRPTGDAIFVYAVSGLEISSSKIDGIVPLPGIGGDGIDVVTSSGVPVPTNPGNPENIAGTLVISDNDIDLTGGTAADNTVGVLVFSVGVPGATVEAHVSGNKITNTTEPAINFRRVHGRVYVERNVITTGSIASQNAPGPEAIRVANTGSYLIANNSIDCQWADPAAKGIGVFSQLAAWPVDGAVVLDNKVMMNPPTGTVFAPGSGGINIRGFAQGNVVLRNRIRGSAGAGLSLYVFKGGTPDNNAFVLNDFKGFDATVADIYVGALVTNTRIVGSGTIVDQGVGTIIQPMAF
jgi:Right handed beta helix region